MGLYRYVQFTEIVDGKLQNHIYYDVGKIEYLNLACQYNIVKKSKYM